MSSGLRYLSPGNGHSFAFLFIACLFSASNAATAFGLSTLPQQVPDADATEAVVVLSPLKALRQLIDRGQTTEAKLVLEALDLAIKGEFQPTTISSRDWIELEFLRGRLAVLDGQAASAVAIFENILSRYPDIVRVRLELGLALFQMKQDQRANYHLDLALQQAVPEVTAKRVQGLKQIMRQRRRWQVSVKVAAVPDSNINAATDAPTVDLFGLPFVLDEDARRRTGLGALASINILNSIPMSRGVVLASELGLRHVEYKGGQFDDTLASFYAGPEISSATKRIGLRLGGFRRWFGQNGFNWGTGGLLNATLLFTRAWSGGLNFGAHWIGYDQLAARTGFSLQVEPFVQRAIGASGQVRSSFAYRKDFAREKSQANTTIQYGMSFKRELRNNVRLGLKGLVGLRSFRAAQVPFDARREDRFFSLGAQITIAGIRFLGSALEASYDFQQSNSNVALFDYARHRFEIGFTKEF